MNGLPTPDQFKVDNKKPRNDPWAEWVKINLEPHFGHSTFLYSLRKNKWGTNQAILHYALRACKDKDIKDLRYFIAICRNRYKEISTNV